MWHDIKQILNTYSRFIVTTHVNPDGDGIGASSAMVELLLQLDKDVRFVCEGPIPARFLFLDYHGLFEAYDPATDYSDTEVLIVLDAHAKERIGRVASLLAIPGIVSLCIDHHSTSSASFTNNVILDTNACSVGAMVYALYQDCGCDLNLCAATGIYTSVVCDTGRFSYSSTSHRAHRIADACISRGVDPDQMYHRLFQNISLSQIKSFANALQRMEIHLDNKVVVQQLRRADLVDALEHFDVEYMHEFNKSIREVECVILLRELEDGLIRISLRSKSLIDVGQIVKSMGGGGHSKAAGATLRGSMDDIKNQILSLLGHYLGDQRQMAG